MFTLRSAAGSCPMTLFCTWTVKAKSTATMIVGTIVKTISTGRLYCVWRGGTSESPARLRWKIIAQNIAPQVITPTTRAATADHVQNSRMAVAWGVTPTGQPNRRASSTEHPVVSGMVTAARAASFAAGPNRCLPRCARPTARAPSTRTTNSLPPPPPPARRPVARGEPSSQVAVHLLRPVGRVAEHTPYSPAGCGAPWCPTRSAYSVTVCGLLGLLTSGADAERRAGPVADALRCARHRGPDESGTWNDADVVFGFTRLSIIDVEGSHQPLPYADGRYTIVFNGEIYNYLELREELACEHGATFGTEGDTEAIVAAYHHWGPASVARLRG